MKRIVLLAVLAMVGNAAFAQRKDCIKCDSVLYTLKEISQKLDKKPVKRKSTTVKTKPSESPLAAKAKQDSVSAHAQVINPIVYNTGSNVTINIYTGTTPPTVLYDTGRRLEHQSIVRREEYADSVCKGLNYTYKLMKQKYDWKQYAGSIQYEKDPYRNRRRQPKRKVVPIAQGIAIAEKLMKEDRDSLSYENPNVINTTIGAIVIEFDKTDGKRHLWAEFKPEGTVMCDESRTAHFFYAKSQKS